MRVNDVSLFLDFCDMSCSHVAAGDIFVRHVLDMTLLVKYQIAILRVINSACMCWCGAGFPQGFGVGVSKSEGNLATTDLGVCLFPSTITGGFQFYPDFRTWGLACPLLLFF